MMYSCRSNLSNAATTPSTMACCMLFVLSLKKKVCWHSGRDIIQLSYCQLSTVWRRSEQQFVSTQLWANINTATSLTVSQKRPVILFVKCLLIKKNDNNFIANHLLNPKVKELLKPTKIRQSDEGMLMVGVFLSHSVVWKNNLCICAETLRIDVCFLLFL